MRTHLCGDIGEDAIGKRAAVCGWAHSRAKNQQIAKTPAPTTIARTAEAHKYARKNAGAESGGNNKKTKLPVILD